MKQLFNFFIFFKMFFQIFFQIFKIFMSFVTTIYNKKIDMSRLYLKLYIKYDPGFRILYYFKKATIWQNIR